MTMVVDIKTKRAPRYTVASIRRVGPYSSNMLRAEFGRLLRYAKKRRLRTGKWFLYFLDEPGSRPARKLRSEACLEIRGKAKPYGKVKVKRLPRQTVLSVTFNPNKISPGLVYSALYGRLSFAGLREAGPSREVYVGSPWTNPRAWANAEVQLPVKRK